MFEREGVSTHYVVTAILVAASREVELRRAVDAVRARHFGRGEIKSSGIGSNDARRLRVLADLATLPFKFVSLVVDKRVVSRDGGLIYKQPFIKFVHRQLFARLYRTHPDLRLIADEHGSGDFMDGFKSYVVRHVERDLFREPSFDFAASATEPLVQLADFMGGTVARLYDPKRMSEAAPEFVHHLRERALVIFSWPIEERSVATVGGTGSTADRRVREYALQRVFSFLMKRREALESPEDRAQAAVVEHLLFEFQLDENRYVPTARLREVLVEQGVSGFEEQQQFRSAVIAKLRDKGLLLASSPRGYKIPSCVGDVLDFVKQTDKMVHPMIGRLANARDNIRLLTEGSVDIIADERYAYLRELLDRGPLARDDDTSDTGADAE